MKTIIADTCDVVFKRLSDGKVILTAEAQLASVTQSIEEERVKGGIGNRDIAILRSEKEVELQVRSAVFDSDWLEMVSGTSYEEETNTIHKKEDGLIVVAGDPDALEVKMEGTPKVGGKVYLFDSKGVQQVLEESELVDGTITLGTEFPDAKVGDIMTALYELDVTGQSLTLDATKFPSNFRVEYSTVEYDIDTNEIINDLYWIFNSATPGGDFDYSFENGQAITPEVSFTALAPIGSSEIGKVMEVPRA